MRTESDWKQFRAMVPLLRERYLAERNPRLAALLSDPRKTETERFWDALDAMQREAKVLRDCLDGHSRSSMDLHVTLMIFAGMLKEEDLAVFSEGYRESLRSLLEQKKSCRAKEKP